MSTIVHFQIDFNYMCASVFFRLFLLLSKYRGSDVACVYVCGDLCHLCVPVFCAICINRLLPRTCVSMFCVVLVILFAMMGGKRNGQWLMFSGGQLKGP